MRRRTVLMNMIDECCDTATRNPYMHLRSENRSGPTRSLAIKMISALLCLLLTTTVTPAVESTNVILEPVGRPAVSVPGQSVTQLPNGRWMLVGGGAGAETLATIQIRDGITEEFFPAPLAHARTGHTATVLPNGTVLVAGGVGPDGLLVSDAELIDPATGTVVALPSAGPMPRSRHTATLLTNGDVLFVGGIDRTGGAVSAVELWDPRSGHAVVLPSGLAKARFAHEALLLTTGEGLLWGGEVAPGQSVSDGEIYDPRTSRVEGSVGDADSRVSGTRVEHSRSPVIAGTSPAADAVDVPLDALLGIRFNKPLPITRLNATGITLVGPWGAVAGTVSGAEQGMLAFFVPTQELLPATTYTLFITGLMDESGEVLPRTQIRFTTHRIVVPSTTASTASLAVSTPETKPATSSPSKAIRVPNRVATPTVNSKRPALPEIQPAGEDASEDWIPRLENRHGTWHVAGLPGDPPLLASTSALRLSPTGQTAFAGQIRRLNGLPLAGVAVSLGGVSTKTDTDGQFLLTGVPTGEGHLHVDGAGVYSGGRHYTEHFVHVVVAAGETTQLPHPMFLPRVDPATEVAISSPADHEILLTHQAIPGLEVRIPEGTVLRHQDGRIVTHVSITPIPVDRAPYPPPVAFPVYFTLQPGGAYVDGDPSKAIKVIYPNYLGRAPGTRVGFWNYEPTGRGWQIYGYGIVSPDGKQIIPDEGVGFREIMAFGLGADTGIQNTPPNPGPPVVPCNAGDPVDCFTGLFSHTVVDLTVQDVIPITLTRLYRTNDNLQHAFGTGTDLSYDMWITANAINLGSIKEIDLILGNGTPIQYFQESTGSYVYQNTNTPSEFLGSTLTTNSSGGLTIALGSGTHLIFNQCHPCLLASIVDRNGNTVTISRAGTSITQITSPNGRYIQLFRDSFERITQAMDNTGRITSYSYDTLGRLVKAVGTDGYYETYGYDPVTNNINLVTDKRSNSMVQNLFDANARVSQQTLADGAIWKLSYTLGANGAVTQTSVTDPRNYVRQHTFNPSGYPTQTLLAVGKPEQQTFTIVRDPSNLAQSVTDTLARQTVYGYDGFGDVTSVTALSSTQYAVTYVMTYDPVYHQLTSVTDPLGHTSSATVGSAGNTVAVADALGNSTTIAYNSEGLPTAITDPLGHTIQLGFGNGADLSSVTDALNRTTKISEDGLGRLQAILDPLGDQTRYARDPMDRVTSVTNAIGGITSLAYDQNGNLLTVTDPRNVVQTFTYDSRNRRHTYKDPAGQIETYNFDGMSNLTSVVDRKNQTTSITYDGIDRPTLITFQDNSTIAITWDGGNRPTPFVDSLNGTITRQYDGLDRLTQEVTPQGQINYTYDGASRRQTMTVTGKTAVNYTFDNANRLTQVAQGAVTLGFGYDTASRRTTVTLPNTIIGTYAFDNANQLTGITYMSGSTQVGTIGYGYDLAGRRTSLTGTLAAWASPNYAPSVTYDGTNRLTSWNGSSLTYDNNGNVTGFGSATYTWNARNQLTATSAGSSTLAYDALGRRTSTTIGGTTTPFLYDGLNPVTINGNFQLAGGGLDEIDAQIAGSTTSSVLRDGVNSALALTNSSAAITTNYAYSAYGDSSATGTGATSLQYTGRENDGATGLYYYRARYYSPQLGRFISEDPIGIGGGSNFYTYVRGNPIALRDPLGLWSLTVGGYAGLGSEITVGVDHGHWFYSQRVGIGFGGGVTWDPDGGVPGGTDGTCHGIVLASSIQGSVNLGPLNRSLEYGVEMNDQTHDPDTFGGLSKGYTSSAWGLHFGGSIGSSVTMYGH
jgi:RHS repeat-associated protein